MSHSSSGVRALEIILGLIALAGSVLVLFFPGLAIETVLFLFAVVLLVVGLLRLGSAILSRSPSSVRTINVFIGLLAIAVAAVILTFPLIAVGTLIFLLAIGFLVYGIGRIAVGGAAGSLPGWFRGILIVAGLVMVAFAALVIIFPALGVFTLAFYLSIALIFIGIESLATGLSANG
jgi:uncharacterized membrane protein HdeD (DUF308 family)